MAFAIVKSQKISTEWEADKNKFVTISLKEEALPLLLLGSFPLPLTSTSSRASFKTK